MGRFVCSSGAAVRPHAHPPARLADVVVKPYSYRLQRVMRTAMGTFIERTGWHIIVRDSDGVLGVGDVAPWPGFGSDGPSCAEALAKLTAAWAQQLWPTGQSCAHALAALPVEVACGFDGALLDIEAQRAQLSLAAHLGAPRQVAASVGVHALVDNALEAQTAIAQGFTAIKVKIGTHALGDEITRIVALRAAIGPNIGLRLDANGAFSVADAVRLARLLAIVSPEWLEQPVAKDDIAGMAEVRRLGGVPIAADESVMNAQQLEAVIAHQAADVVVLKPMFVGGLRQAIRLGERAQAAKLKVIVTHALESAVGRLHALHVALALGCQSPCGLGGALPQTQLQAAPVIAGRMQPLAGFGLGLTSKQRDGLLC